jgi:hypothetical protein
MCDQHDVSIDGHTIEIAKANLGGNKIKMDFKFNFYFFHFLKEASILQFYSFWLLRIYFPHLFRTLGCSGANTYILNAVTQI